MSLHFPTLFMRSRVVDSILLMNSTQTVDRKIIPFQVFLITTVRGRNRVGPGRRGEEVGLRSTVGTVQRGETRSQGQIYHLLPGGVLPASHDPRCLPRPTLSSQCRVDDRWRWRGTFRSSVTHRSRSRVSDREPSTGTVTEFRVSSARGRIPVGHPGST